jgi:hypothetical protein
VAKAARWLMIKVEGAYMVSWLLIVCSRWLRNEAGMD